MSLGNQQRNKYLQKNGVFFMIFIRLYIKLSLENLLSESENFVFSVSKRRELVVYAEF